MFDARPARPALSVGDPCLNPGAAMIGGLTDVMGMFLQGGWVDVGFLAEARSTSTETSTPPPSAIMKSRKAAFLAPGANPIGALAKKVLIIALHNTRSLAEKVDFITTPVIWTVRAPGSGGGFRRTPVRRSSSPTRPFFVLMRRPKRPISKAFIQGRRWTKWSN